MRREKGLGQPTTTMHVTWIENELKREFREREYGGEQEIDRWIEKKRFQRIAPKEIKMRDERGRRIRNKRDERERKFGSSRRESVANKERQRMFWRVRDGLWGRRDKTARTHKDERATEKLFMCATLQSFSFRGFFCARKQHAKSMNKHELQEWSIFQGTDRKIAS